MRRFAFAFAFGGGVERRREVRARGDAHPRLERRRDHRVDTFGSRRRRGGGARLEPPQHARLENQRHNPEGGLEELFQSVGDGGVVFMPRSQQSVVHGLVQRHRHARRAVERGEVALDVPHGLLHVLQVEAHRAQPERERIIQRPPAVRVAPQRDVGTDGFANRLHAVRVRRRARRARAARDFDLQAPVPLLDERRGFARGGLGCVPVARRDQRVDLDRAGLI